MKVSVILPVYNVATYLHRAIESLLKQTLCDFEAIFIDDGSTDESLSLLRDYERIDPRIKAYAKGNGGAASARNSGLTLAQGEFVYFMDPDDWIDPKTLSDNVQYLQTHQADMVLFGFRNYTEDRSLISKRCNPRFQVFTNNHDVALAFTDLFTQNNTFSVWNKMFRRTWLEHSNLSFPAQKMGEDAIFCMSAFSSIDKLVVNPNCYYNYVCSRPGGAMTNPDFATDVKDEIKILELLQKTFSSWEIDGRVAINSYIAWLLFSKYSTIATFHLNGKGILQYMKYCSKNPYLQIAQKLNGGKLKVPLRARLKLWMATYPATIYCFRYLHALLYR